MTCSLYCIGYEAAMAESNAAGYVGFTPARTIVELAERLAAPIPMVLHCPACGLQHIDAPRVDFSTQPEAVGQLWDGKEHPDHEAALARYEAWEAAQWLNPPHRSHLCHQCGHIWRPADVPTTGVQAVETKGQNDSPLFQPGRGVMK